MRTAVFLVIWTILGIAIARAQPGVVLEAVTDRKYYRENARNEVYVEVRVTPTRPVAAPVPSTRNVVLVLDRSGSMAGEPIQALRQAAAAALDTLAADDVVAIVVFGSEVETLIEAQRRDQARDVEARIAQIEPAGGAALYDALNQGAAQLRRHARPTAINHLILVTDGPPTKGPRAAADFVKLAGVFAGEGTIISTFGLGADFEEDTLAAMARIGNGRFRYVAQPAKLTEALQAEIAPQPALVGHDAILTIEFRRSSGKVQSHGWRAATTEDTTVTYQFPRLLAHQELSVLVSAETDPFSTRFDMSDFAKVRLRWKDARDEVHELSQVVPLVFTADTASIRESINAGVSRTAVNVLLREGMQKAIEQLDKGDFRRALRILRSARSEARDMNFDLEDPRIDEKIRQLDVYLAEVQARGMSQLDRKILRSGLFNQFDPPNATETASKR
jgi:Ca-activated chloride channel homolog